MTPCTPVSRMQRSTSRKHWMLPLANTGMATAFLPGGRHGLTQEWVAAPAPWRPGPQAPSQRPRRLPPLGFLPLSTHRTALMCSQDAGPDSGPFCSLVRPCTVSS